MSKSILVLTGSPRKGGNSDLLADAFIEGAKRAGHKVSRFDAGRKKVQGCRACEKCFSQGNACIFDDDFNEFASLLENADVLVMVSPLYWFSFSAQFKAVFDKVFSFDLNKTPLKVKETVLITCGAEDQREPFDGIIKSYERICAYLQWQDKGQLVATGVYHKGDVLGSDYVVQAQKLGEML